MLPGKIYMHSKLFLFFQPLLKGLVPYRPALCRGTSSLISYPGTLDGNIWDACGYLFDIPRNAHLQAQLGSAGELISEVLSCVTEEGTWWINAMPFVYWVDGSESDMVASTSCLLCWPTRKTAFSYFLVSFFCSKILIPGNIVSN